MPRTKKTPSKEPQGNSNPENAPTTPTLPSVPAWVSSQATEAEEQQAAVQRGRVAEGRLQLVECDLEGYEGLVARFRTNNQLEVALLFRDRWKDASNEDRCRVLAWFVRGFPEGWNFLDFEGNPIPVPTPDKPESYSPILSMTDLLRWLRWAGYEKALEQALSPN